MSCRLGVGDEITWAQKGFLRLSLKIKLLLRGSFWCACHVGRKFKTFLFCGCEEQYESHLNCLSWTFKQAFNFYWENLYVNKVYN